MDFSFNSPLLFSLFSITQIQIRTNLKNENGLLFQAQTFNETRRDISVMNNVCLLMLYVTSVRNIYSLHMRRLIRSIFELQIYRNHTTEDAILTFYVEGNFKFWFGQLVHWLARCVIL